MKNTIQTKKRKILIIFDEMIADMLINKKLNTYYLNDFLKEKNQIFLLFLSNNLILLFQKAI